MFIAPAVIFFAVYTLYPVLRAIYLSFTRYQFASIQPPTFIGINNYITAFQDPSVTGGLGKALWFTLLFYPGAIVLPLAVALLLDRVQSPRAGGLYRVLLYIPAIIPSPLIFALWRWMYAPSTGLANMFVVDTLHLTATRPLWVADPLLAMPSIAFMEWWWGLGQMAVFFLVGLSQIPRDLYEAARIDGAGEWQLIRRITLPLLRPTILTWVVLKIYRLRRRGRDARLRRYGRHADDLGALCLGKRIRLRPAECRLWRHGGHDRRGGHVRARIQRAPAAAQRVVPVTTQACLANAACR